MRDGAKLAGLLLERLQDGTVLAGIGVNVAHRPAGMDYPVTSLAALGCAADAPALLDAVLVPAARRAGGVARGWAGGGAGALARPRPGAGRDPAGAARHGLDGGAVRRAGAVRGAAAGHRGGTGARSWPATCARLAALAACAEPPRSPLAPRRHRRHNRPMLKLRVIPCLDVKDGRVVKGVNFVALRDAGDPVEQAALYDAAGADELTFLDITASHENRDTIYDVVSRTAARVFLPLTVGGGVRSTGDMRGGLAAGPGRTSAA